MTEPTKHEGGQPAGGTSRHAAPDGADRDPLIDMDRDPTPGVADHAAPATEADDRT